MATADALMAVGMPVEQAKAIVDLAVLTGDTQTITGVKTMSGANVITHAPNHACADRAEGPGLGREPRCDHRARQ